MVAKMDDYKFQKQKADEFGKYCISNQFTWTDMQRISDVKRYGKEELLDYILNNGINLNDLKKAHARFNTIGF